MYNKTMENEKSIPKLGFKPLKILTYPNAKLRIVSKNVRPEVNLKEVQELASLMHKTMKFMEGIGLAAPQVGIGLRVITINLQDGKTNPLTLLNPVLLNREGQQDSHEGCLSLPQVSGDVLRAQSIDIKYLDENAEEKTLHAEGLLAACIQHEMDHLEGILYIDRVSGLRRDMIIRRYKKIGRL